MRRLAVRRRDGAAVAHVLPDGHVDEYPVEGFLQTRKLARGADCRIWLSGSGDGRPELATFELVPRRL